MAPALGDQMVDDLTGGGGGIEPDVKQVAALERLR